MLKVESNSENGQLIWKAQTENRFGEKMVATGNTVTGIVSVTYWGTPDKDGDCVIEKYTYEARPHSWSGKPAEISGRGSTGKFSILNDAPIKLEPYSERSRIPSEILRNYGLALDVVRGVGGGAESFEKLLFSAMDLEFRIELADQRKDSKMAPSYLNIPAPVR